MRNDPPRAGAAAVGIVLAGAVRLHVEGIAALLAQDERVDVMGVELRSPHTEDPSPLASGADVVVVDSAAPGGSEATCRIASAARAPVVALGVPSDEQVVVAFAEAGVLGFVERDAAAEVLVAAVLCAARGEASFPARIATTLLRRVAAAGGQLATPDRAGLTAREREIVGRIEEGLSNKEIAAQLCIEVATVKNHVHNILEKLNVSRRAEAVARLRVIEGGMRSPLASLGGPGPMVGSSVH